MTKRITSFLLLAVLALCTAGAWAQQMAVVKGNVKDEASKPIAGATLEFSNLDTGHKSTVKTNGHGDYLTMAVTAGTYNVKLTGPDGKLLYTYSNVSVHLTGDNVLDFDMAKLHAEDVKSPAMTEEQRKQYEAQKANSMKIQGLNAMLNQASAQMSSKDYEGAVATLEPAATPEQTHPEIFSSLADAYMGAKKYDKAEEAYRKAIALAPPTSTHLAAYHSGLALAEAQQGKSDALAECDKTAQIDPALGGTCYFNEGAVLTNQGKVDDAGQAFDKAIAADPTKADAYYWKGVNLMGKATLSKDGKMNPAPGTTEALNKYLELAPDGKYAQGAKELLASLGASVQTSYGTSKKGKK